MLFIIFDLNNADGGIRTPERSRAPAFMVKTLTFEAGVLPLDHICFKLYSLLELIRKNINYFLIIIKKK